MSVSKAQRDILFKMSGELHERKRQLHSHSTRAARGPADGVPRMAWHAPGLRSEPVGPHMSLRTSGWSTAQGWSWHTG